MVNPKGSKTIYFNKDQTEVVDKFTAEEITTLLDEGRGLFELTMANPTKKELDYLEKHPKLRRTIEKW